MGNGAGSIKSFDQQLYRGPTAVGPAFESALPAGSLVIFTSATIHGRNTFKVPAGQRYVLKHAWGRADHDWEGQGPMGSVGLLAGRPSPGRGCHYVKTLIQTRFMAAVIVCIFERVWVRIVT